ncbi:MAG: ClbS/DfsB family four-helix bundle protein [Chloroflexota bacterium]
MQLKDRLLDLLRWADAREQAFAAGLSSDERQAVGSFEHWSAKDLIAHLAAWKQRLADQIAAVVAGEAPSSYEDIDHENAAIYREYHPLPWDEVMRRSRLAQQNLTSAAERFDERQLAEPLRSPWLRGQPLWRRIAGTGFIHPMVHWSQFLGESGKVDQALALSEQAAEQASPLSDTPEWQGLTLYNLACAYALAGAKNKAPARLKEALHLRPDLVEWSKQDPDLASIRDDPSFAGAGAP